MDRLDALVDWLIDGASGATTSAEVILRLGRELPLAGVPIHRISAFVTTLHPQVLGRMFRWIRDQPVEIGELSHALQESDAYHQSPIAETIKQRVEFRHRIDSGTTTSDYAILRELAQSGYTDYVSMPMVFTSGQSHAIAFATMHEGGFTAAQLAALRLVVRPLARIAEIFALRRTAANLLSTYVGRDSGERILAGHITRGDIETLRAVIWFSDLRGFTELSERLSPRAVIDTLNELFECQVPAIERHGGEVLKFIGDGLLAIFPVQKDSDSPARCEDALEAADEAFLALARRNAAAPNQIQYGLALHIGEIAYGNVGGASRLDFTAIGAAVNLTARLESLTGKLGRPLLVSEELARHASRPLEDVGGFELKGIPGTLRVFAPPRLPGSSPESIS